ncbi:MAG TPA: hypothetical protein VF817_03825 [Patescibacteria group bacterium]
MERIEVSACVGMKPSLFHCVERALASAKEKGFSIPDIYEESGWLVQLLDQINLSAELDSFIYVRGEIFLEKGRE